MLLCCWWCCASSRLQVRACAALVGMRVCSCAAGPRVLRLCRLPAPAFCRLQCTECSISECTPPFWDTSGVLKTGVLLKHWRGVFKTSYSETHARFQNQSAFKIAQAFSKHGCSQDTYVLKRIGRAFSKRFRCKTVRFRTSKRYRTNGECQATAWSKAS